MQYKKLYCVMYFLSPFFIYGELSDNYPALIGERSKRNEIGSNTKNELRLKLRRQIVKDANEQKLLKSANQNQGIGENKKISRNIRSDSGLISRLISKSDEEKNDNAYNNYNFDKSISEDDSLNNARIKEDTEVNYGEIEPSDEDKRFYRNMGGDQVQSSEDVASEYERRNEFYNQQNRKKRSRMFDNQVAFERFHKGSYPGMHLVEGEEQRVRKDLSLNQDAIMAKHPASITNRQSQINDEREYGSELSGNEESSGQKRFADNHHQYGDSAANEEAEDYSNAAYSYVRKNVKPFGRNSVPFDYYNNEVGESDDSELQEKQGEESKMYKEKQRKRMAERNFHKSFEQLDEKDSKGFSEDGHAYEGYKDENSEESYKENSGSDFHKRCAKPSHLAKVKKNNDKRNDKENAERGAKKEVEKTRENESESKAEQRKHEDTESELVHKEQIDNEKSNGKQNLRNSDSQLQSDEEEKTKVHNLRPESLRELKNFDKRSNVTEYIDKDVETYKSKRNSHKNIGLKNNERLSNEIEELAEGESNLRGKSAQLATQVSGTNILGDDVDKNKRETEIKCDNLKNNCNTDASKVEEGSKTESSAEKNRECSQKSNSDSESKYEGNADSNDVSKETDSKEKESESPISAEPDQNIKKSEYTEENKNLMKSMKRRETKGSSFQDEESQKEEVALTNDNTVKEKDDSKTGNFIDYSNSQIPSNLRNRDFTAEELNQSFFTPESAKRNSKLVEKKDSDYKTLKDDANINRLKRNEINRNEKSNSKKFRFQRMNETPEPEHKSNGKNESVKRNSDTVKSDPKPEANSKMESKVASIKNAVKKESELENIEKPNVSNLENQEGLKSQILDPNLNIDDSIEPHSSIKKRSAALYSNQDDSGELYDDTKRANFPYAAEEAGNEDELSGDSELGQDFGSKKRSLSQFSKKFVRNADQFPNYRNRRDPNTADESNADEKFDNILFPGSNYVRRKREEMNRLKSAHNVIKKQTECEQNKVGEIKSDKNDNVDKLEAMSSLTDGKDYVDTFGALPANSINGELLRVKRVKRESPSKLEKIKSVKNNTSKA